MQDGRSQLSAFHEGQVLTEGLLLVREDICDWLNALVPSASAVSGPELLERLHTGVLLCDLAVRVDSHLQSGSSAPVARRLPARWPAPPRADRKATPGSFRAKDNIALFLDWCRGLGMANTILFETRGLVASDEEKNVVLALLHLGEMCAEWRPDMPLPQFARFKLELAQANRESEKFPRGVPHSRSVNNLDDPSSSESGSISTRSDSNANHLLVSRDVVDTARPKPSTRASLAVPHAGGTNTGRPSVSGTASARTKQPVSSSSTRPTKFVKNVKTAKSGARRISQQNMGRSKSRDDIVKLTESPTAPAVEEAAPNIDLKIKEITNRCRCHIKFVVERTTLQEGMYKIGSKNIFVRMFRGNIMLRVGGGWETLNEYVNKVDPCCKSGTDSSNTFPRRQSLGLNLPSSGGLVNKNFRKSSQSELTSVKRQAASPTK